MDSIFVGVGEHLDVFVPIALVTLHVASQHHYDSPIVALSLSVGMRVIGPVKIIRNAHHLETWRKHYDAIWLPLCVITVSGAPYLKNHCGVKARGTV